MLFRSIEKARSAPDGFNEISGWLSSLMNEDKTTELTERLSDPTETRSMKNMLETIRYLLVSRNEIGRQADFYGLLATRSRRFLVVEPGEEWIVVLSGLSSKEPGAHGILRDLRAGLRDLGIEAQRTTVIQELERAGLARSSHDADDAILIWAGF